MYDHSHFGDRSSIISITMMKLTLTIATLAAICLVIPTFAFKQRASKSNRDNNKIGVLGVMKYFKPKTNSEELRALGNYILDNPIVKRTPITENIYDLDEIEDVPCTCEQKARDVKLLGEDYFPAVIETRSCDIGLCPAPYGCKERLHNVTVLRRKRFMGEPSEEVLPADLNNRWIAVKEPVVVGCMCVKEY